MFLVEKISPHSPENFRTGYSFSVSLLSDIDKVWVKKGGRVSKISVENLLSQSAE